MIALITPTGSRSAQFNLCQMWMKNQTYTGKVTWIIVDDCHPRTTDRVTEDFRENWTIVKVYPTPIWQGQNTQARNIREGIKAVPGKDVEAIFIIEDDDYYRPRYLERMMANFGTDLLVGERNTIYYNVYHRRYITNPNTAHASLFQTAFKPEAIPVFESCYFAKFIDCVFWSKVTKRHLFYENDLAVGMKGMPGRGGIGAGHSRAMNMREDPNMNYLQKLIGDDAKHYAGYYGGGSMPKHPLFTKKSL